jgi:hypothetical protein
VADDGLRFDAESIQTAPLNAGRKVVERALDDQHEDDLSLVEQIRALALIPHVNAQIEVAVVAGRAG